MSERDAIVAWQPIETAPKDGTIIILTAFDVGGEQLEEWPMQWAHIQKNGLFPGVAGMWTAPDGSVTWNGDAEGGGPTHWKPGSDRNTGDHLPASVADDSRLDWNIPDNLRWLAEQPNRPQRVPCGYLTGQFLKLCADRWSTHAGEVEGLREALKLAANRLARAALDHDVSSSKFLEVSEWGEEARQALEASR